MQNFIHNHVIGILLTVMLVVAVTSVMMSKNTPQKAIAQQLPTKVEAPKTEEQIKLEKAIAWFHHKQIENQKAADMAIDHCRDSLPVEMTIDDLTACIRNLIGD